MDGLGLALLFLAPFLKWALWILAAVTLLIVFPLSIYQIYKKNQTKKKITEEIEKILEVNDIKKYSSEGLKQLSNKLKSELEFLTHFKNFKHIENSQTISAEITQKDQWWLAVKSFIGPILIFAGVAEYSAFFAAPISLTWISLGIFAPVATIFGFGISVDALASTYDFYLNVPELSEEQCKQKLTEIIQEKYPNAINTRLQFYNDPVNGIGYDRTSNSLFLGSQPPSQPHDSSEAGTPPEEADLPTFNPQNAEENFNIQPHLPDIQVSKSQSRKKLNTRSARNNQSSMSSMSGSNSSDSESEISDLEEVKTRISDRRKKRQKDGSNYASSGSETSDDERPPQTLQTSQDGTSGYDPKTNGLFSGSQSPSSLHTQTRTYSGSPSPASSEDEFENVSLSDDDDTHLGVRQRKVHAIDDQDPKIVEVDENVEPIGLINTLLGCGKRLFTKSEPSGRVPGASYGNGPKDKDV